MVQKMNDGKYDLTSGGILKKLLLVAIPIMGTQLMQMAYNLTDMFWLGRVTNSVAAVAASGLGGMFLWFGMAFMMVGRMGAEIGTAQNLGRDDVNSARDYAQNSTRIALLLGTIYGAVLLIFAKPLISLFQVQDPDVLTFAGDYLRITGLGVPFVFLAAAITGAFNGAGNSRLSFLANALGLVVNMILDPLMIHVLDWGVKGAAIATVIAQTMVLLLFLLVAKRHSRRPFERFNLFGRFDWNKIRQIMRWSLPMAFESGAFTILAMIVTAMVSAWYGETAVAVQRVGSQIESLSWLIGGGFASAITAFVGQNYGARKYQRIRRGYRISLAALLFWEIVVTILLFVGGRFFFSLFLQQPPEILDMGATYLKILAACQIFMALEGASSGVFRGIGYTLPPSLCSIVSNLLRPLLCWLFAQWMGLNGMWVGVTISAALRGLFMFTWYTLTERRMLLQMVPFGHGPIGNNEAS